MISVKIHKPSISVMKSNKIYEKEKIIHNNLLLHYSKFEYSYSCLCINNLMFNEHCQVVARFKDFLILDDMTEFLRRYYAKRELKKRLIKIFNFYESYSKIFPNYMILPESKYLYRNIRKKQKMIDAFNQIKKEEEENRNSLKKEMNKKDKGEMIVFNKSIQESINRYHPSTSSFLFNSIISGFAKNNNYNNSESYCNSLISISLNKPYPLNNKKINNNNSTINSFEYDNDEITLNSEYSLINIVQTLNKKYDNNINSNTYKNIVFKGINNNNNKENSKIIHNYNDKTKKSKNLIKKQINKKLNKVNIANENNTKNGKDKSNNVSTPPKNISPGHNQMVKHHNHQKSALNNNKKFISHKQAVSVSNNTNTIKIINNINNIIINDGNINKEMVININTNYFELNNTNVNNINTIDNYNENNNDNIHKKNRNSLIKKINIKSKSKSKETSLNNKKNSNIVRKKLNNNYKFDNNIINKTLEEKRTYTLSNHILNNLNYPNNNLFNNNVLNINNANTTTNTKSNKSKKKKDINDNKPIKRISEYKCININNIGNNANLNNNKTNNNKTKDRNKKAITIDIEQFDKIKQSQSKKRTNDRLTSKEDKKSLNKHKFNVKPQNKKTFEILNTDGKMLYNINTNSNTYSKNFLNTENNNNALTINNNLNNKNDKKEKKCVKSNHIQSKLNKRVMSRKQKTNSLHIKSKNIYFSSFNNNRLSKELNSIKRNNISNNDNFINEHIKNFTQGNFDLEKTKTKKFLNLKEHKEISEKKTTKISAKEMKDKYHKFMQGNKFIHGSYDTSNRLHLFKKFSSLYNNHNTNINNITEISQRKIIDKYSPFKINNIISTPGSKISNKNVKSNLTKNLFGSNFKNYDKTSFKKKIQNSKKDDNKEKNKYLIYKISGLKNKIIINDGNNKKMKFVKKMK